jgi:hypothetical protein
MRKLSVSVACGMVAVICAGCVVYTQPAYRPVAYEPAPAPGGPVVVAPGVVAIDVEPPPPERVYVYDPGYPPGCYFYGGFYWYGGYRYPHDVFINRYVTVNVRENRYVNVEENRRVTVQVQERQRQEYVRNGGHPGPGVGYAAEHPKKHVQQ